MDTFSWCFRARTWGNDLHRSQMISPPPASDPLSREQFEYDSFALRERQMPQFYCRIFASILMLSTFLLRKSYSSRRIEKPLPQKRFVTLFFVLSPRDEDLQLNENAYYTRNSKKLNYSVSGSTLRFAEPAEP